MRPTPGDLDDADALVVPGVGAAAPAMERLDAAGLVDPILRWIADDRPFLGICLGLQLLFEGSDEDGAATLGVLPGRTRRLEDAPTLPHIGWNQVERRRDHPVFDGHRAGRRLLLRPLVRRAARRRRRRRWSSPRPTHGGSFVSAVARGQLVGVQFHPERSGDDGLRLLGNFVGARPGAHACRRPRCTA